MFKKILLSLAVFGISVASAKTYHVTLAEPYSVGSQTLKPGEYHVIVNGTTAVLADPANKQTKINGKIENENRRFTETAILSRDEAGKARLDAIQIGGTHVKVDFN